ncbi:alpha-ketoglutarate-dependent dioxygenase AlkB [Pyruvatibacter mobilis]|uniref:alpha-ketoglutarate-dependent dioxygenase AlkB n=1 Tax=Pyruvatibacter mobilis TaxID=1712261 RepID=UPI003BAFF8E3
MKRCVQHYGYRYDYRACAVTEDAFLGELPGWLQELAATIWSTARFEEVPDQVIINEYEPGQGISAHVDCVPCFSETIASLSLLSACTMNFEERSSGERLNTVLAPRSLLVLKGPSRYLWTHSIPARKSGMIDGQRVARSRRLSLTFRKVIRS